MSSQSAKNELEKNEPMIPIDSIHEISIQDLAAFREFQRLQEYASKSQIVSTVSQGDDITTVSFIEKELADTIAHLDAEIKTRMAKGKVCFDQHARKIRALKTLSDLIFTKRQVALNEAINLKSKSFELVFKELLDLVKSCAEKVGVPDFHVDALFSELSRSVENWAEKTQKKISAQDS